MNNKIPFLRQLLDTVFFTVLVFAVVIGFVTIFSPEKYARGLELDDSCDASSLHEKLSPESVGSLFKTITDFGSRAPGQPGAAKTAKLIEDTFRGLGLEVVKQDVPIAYPKTLEGSGFIQLADSSRIKAWPFMPNYVQTVTTGPGGISGELFLANEENIRATADFTDKIAVIDLSKPVFADLGLTPTQYAALGFKAVVFTHADGIEKLPWTNTSTMDKIALKKLPVNIVRVAVDPSVLSHIGERVTMDVRSAWTDVHMDNVIGILRAPKATSDVLLVPFQYDAMSSLPDLANTSDVALGAAIALRLAEGLAPLREHFTRDVIFIGTPGVGQSQVGASRVLSTLGANMKSAAMRGGIKARTEENLESLALVEQVRALFDDPAFATFEGREATVAAMDKLPKNVRKYLNKRFTASVRFSSFMQGEALLQAKIKYHRNPDSADKTDFNAFTAQKKLNDDLNNLAALPLDRALERKLAKDRVFFTADGAQTSLRDSFKAYIDHLYDYHKAQAAVNEVDQKLSDLLVSYENFIGISTRLIPTAGEPEKEIIGYAAGYGVNNGGDSANAFVDMLQYSIKKLKYETQVEIARPNWSGFKDSIGYDLDSNPYSFTCLPVYSLMNPKNKFTVGTYPFARPEMAEQLVSVRRSLDIVAEMAIASARGFGNFHRLSRGQSYDMSGSVYVSGIGTSVVPNYELEGALVCSPDGKPRTFTDPYGRYSRPFLSAPPWDRWQPIDAFYFNNDGEAMYAKDYGSTAQFIYSTRTMPHAGVPANLILYRGAPVALLDFINPQSLKAFSGVEFVSRSGLTGFGSTCPFNTVDGLMNFVPPDERFFITLKAGAADNELVATTRAFCLGTSNTNDLSFKPSENEIDGPGYLAQDTPFVYNLSSEATSSMAWLADKRLALQQKYGMADEMTLSFSSRAAEIASGDDVAPEAPHLTRQRGIRRALSYLILNHPVIRSTVSEAVWGILWYMGLLVPFVFFFEKLVFGFTDVRKQILAEAVIFLVVFSLLRILHPAFHMIRSSAMILLGFVVIIIVLSVMAVMSSKFKENIDELRKAQGGVKNGGENKFGIVMTAFMLGLNNMHKRKVRTGLTCATLVLMTFVMICFTSVQSNVIDKEKAVGRAMYQGILVREKLYAPIPQAEIDALKSTFNESCPISARSFCIGYMYDKKVQPLNLEVIYGEGDNSSARTLTCALGFDYTEPLARSMKLLSTNGWFTAEQASRTEEPFAVILPDTVAEQLGIYPEAVDKGPVPVTINSKKYEVWNIFDTANFQTLTDLDGQTLMPFDPDAIANTALTDGLLLAEPTDPKIAPEQAILVLNGQIAVPDEHSRRTASAVVDLGAMPYTKAKHEISGYLEQTGRECSYGIDGTSFTGCRARVRSLSGLAELLIPLIIAALTVLNTMKGSVYERKDEIFVYNAVGIAPRYVFFMFVAEALVYSVVGAVLGYILSQGIGRILTALDWTGGMNMNFTSINTIYASLAISAATIASTWFPARSAMEIAKPADNAGWTLPPPDADDSITIMLPFTFTKYDRIAILAFFYNYFDSLGEGSAGAFFSGEPVLKVSDHTDDLADGAYIPCVEVQVWLKPFDLGVSQMIRIELVTDPDTKEFIAKMRLIRVTGTRDSWVRLNSTLVAAIRRHFLLWRAVPTADKIKLFEQARGLLLESSKNA